MLFPLPLTAFENYMLADDREDQPMSFFLRMSFWGSLNQAAFTAAVERTVVRHPLFRAFVREVDGRPTWVRSGATKPQVFWSNGEENVDQSGYINLATEVGLRIFVGVMR